MWWDQPGQPSQLLATAKVLLTSAPAGALPSNGKIHVGTQWDGALQELTSWAVPAQAPHTAAANIALLIATDPARLAQFTKATGLGPVTQPAIALLPADLRAQNPSLPAHQQSALTIDENFWAENTDKLEARFTTWAAK